MSETDGFMLRCPYCRRQIAIEREAVGNQLPCPLCQKKLLALWHPDRNAAMLHSVAEIIQTPTLRQERTIPLLWLNLALIPLSFVIFGVVAGFIVLVLVFGWFAFWWKMEVKNRILNILDIVAHIYTYGRCAGDDDVLLAELAAYTYFQIAVTGYHSSIPRPGSTPAMFDLIVLANTAATVLCHRRLWGAAGQRWQPEQLREVIGLISSRVAYYGIAEKLKGGDLPEDFILVATQDGAKSEPGW